MHVQWRVSGEPNINHQSVVNAVHSGCYISRTGREFWDHPGRPNTGATKRVDWGLSALKVNLGRNRYLFFWTSWIHSNPFYLIYQIIQKPTKPDLFSRLLTFHFFQTLAFWCQSSFCCRGLPAGVSCSAGSFDHVIISFSVEGGKTQQHRWMDCLFRGCLLLLGKIKQNSANQLEIFKKMRNKKFKWGGLKQKTIQLRCFLIPLLVY